MELTVESLCNQLARNQLLDGEAIRQLRGRWRAEAGSSANNVSDFRKWLVRGGSFSDFQLEMVERGYGDFLTFAAYKLLQRMGTGRMAGVYRATHPLGQIVAIKILPPSKSKHPQILGRFLRESRLAVKLDHDNLVRTFHNGRYKDMYYIVMEFLEGETLEDTLARRKRLPVTEAVPILLQALQGLDHLQDVGVVHRDLKPRNLMLVPGENPALGDSTLQSTVKILDIGLGRALFDEGTPGAAEAAELTSEGAILGTLNYMAPEQARNAHTADIRADIYSLGCVLYEMLTGHPPFEDTNFARQMRRHAEELPKPLTELVPGLPPAVDHVVRKMLAKDPALRYATPSQVIKEVKALTASIPQAKPLRPMRSYLTWLESQPRYALPDQIVGQQEVESFSTPGILQPLNDGGPIPAAANGASVGKLVALPWATPLVAPINPPQNGLRTGINPFLKSCRNLWQTIRAFGWQRRDWIVAALGAGGILVLQFIIWIVRR